MKINFLILFLILAIAGKAQSKDEKELTAKTYLLSHTIFGTKDSLTLEKLAAKTVSYGHSHGNLQTREEMIKGVVHNQSNYTDTAVSNIKIFIKITNNYKVRVFLMMTSIYVIICFEK